MTAHSDALAELSAAGVAVWLDDINRVRLTSGNLADLVRDRHVVGVTSNPTIFDHALSHGDAYNEQLADLALRGVSVEEASRAITTYDIRWACDVLRPVYDASDGVDGRVSIEVDPRLAGDTEKTIAEARALWWLVDRPNLFIKIPATPAGLPAIAAVPVRGHQHQRDADLLAGAVRRGHRRVLRRDGEGRRGRPRPVLDRVGGVVLRQPGGHRGRQRLDKIGTPEAAELRGKAAVANARLAYQLFEERFAESSPRWSALHGKGARLQRPLWASTSTKDPAYPDTMYVVELVAPDTVNTMPEATILAVADHGALRGDAVRGTYEAVQEGVRGPGGPRHRLRGRGHGPRGRGRVEVRRVLAGAAGHDSSGAGAPMTQPGEVEAPGGRGPRRPPWRVGRLAQRRGPGGSPPGRGQARGRRPAVRAGGQGPGAVGPGRGRRGGDQARLAGRAPGVAGAARLPGRARQRRARAGARPRRAVRDGRLVAGPRGDQPRREGPAHPAGHDRPAPGAPGTGRPAGPDARGGLQQERLDHRDRQPPAGVRAGVRRPGPEPRRDRPPVRDGHRSRLAAGGHGPRGRLPRGARRSRTWAAVTAR